VAVGNNIINNRRIPEGGDETEAAERIRHLKSKILPTKMMLRECGTLIPLETLSHLVEEVNENLFGEIRSHKECRRPKHRDILQPKIRTTKSPLQSKNLQEADVTRTNRNMTTLGLTIRAIGT
jgi:hypothetical protein